jgi:outer membrane protein assembly factor BamB
MAGPSMYDRKLRAFDATTGKLLWEYELPYAGTATPATYSVGGGQAVSHHLDQQRPQSQRAAGERADRLLAAVRGRSGSEAYSVLGRAMSVYSREPSAFVM